MREFYDKIFNLRKHPGKLKEMLWFYEKGWSLSALGRKYGVGHDIIKHHTKKHKIIPCIHPSKQSGIARTKKQDIATFQITQLILPTTYNEPSKYSHISERIINHGKNYKDYREIEEQKNKSTLDTKLDALVGL